MGLIQELQRGDAQRRREVATLAREVSGRLGDFRRDGARRRRELSAALNSDVTAIRSDVKSFIGQLHRASHDRRRQVKGMCADAGAFVGRLHQISADRRSQVATMKREVAGQRADHRSFIGHLRRLGAERHARVWGSAAPTARAVSAAPGRKPAAVPAGLGASEQEPVTLRDVIFTYLAEHRRGSKLTQMEQDLSIPRTKLAKEIQNLIGEKKARKRKLLYFATLGSGA